jgi:hypothetical protein
MSIFNAFRSGGRANKRGYFDFQDEFGQDPIRSRYANTSFAEKDSEARVSLAASETELAKASLEAMTEPAKKTFEYLNNINQTAKLKDDMMRQSRISARSVQLREQIDKANNWDTLTAIESDPDNAEALQSEELKARYDARLNAVRAAGIGALKNRLPKAMSTGEVNGLVNEYSWLAGDDEAVKLINTFTPLAQRREAAIKGLQEKGVQQMPVTRGGEFDVDRAETALSGGYTREDVSTYRTILQNLNSQRANIFDPESPEAKELDGQIQTVSGQLLAAGNQNTQQSARAQLELQSLGAGVPEDQDADFDSTFGPGASLTPRSEAPADKPVTPTSAEPSPMPAPTEQSSEPELESEAETARKAKEAKVTAQSDRVASDIETLTEERDRLYKRGYKFSPSKEQRETYARVDQAVSDSRNEEADARRQRRAEIDSRLKEIGQFPNDPQLREEAQALLEEKRRLTGVKIF